MIVLGLSGSLRRGSYNRAAAAGDSERAAARRPPRTLGRLGRGPALQDTEQDPPDAVRRLRQAIRAADAVLIATPEFKSSIPGQLKNALDWASRPFPDCALKDKPAAVIGASTGLFGAMWAQAETRKVLNRIGARVVEEGLTVGQATTHSTSTATCAPQS
jgi:chromate reductase